MLFEDHHSFPTNDYSSMRQWSWQLFTDISSARDIWEKLEAQSTIRVFQTYAWISAWYKEIGCNEGFEPRIVVGRCNGKVSALFPMALKRNIVGTSLVWLAEDWKDYNMPIAHVDLELNPIEVSKLWEMVFEVAGPADILELVKQSPIRGHSIFNKFYKENEMLEDDCAFLLQLSSNKQELRDAIHSPKTWHGYKRKLRKLKKIGEEVSFEEASNASDRIALVADMLERKVKALDETGKSNPFKEKSAIAFLTRMVADAPNTCRVFALRVNQKPIAITLCFQEQNNLLLYQTVYDNEYSQYSPGILLLHYIIFSAAAEGMRTFDCSYGADHYKSVICNQKITVGRVVEAYTLKGSVLKFMRYATLSVRRIVKSNPRIYRAALSWNKRLHLIR